MTNSKAIKIALDAIKHELDKATTVEGEQYWKQCVDTLQRNYERNKEKEQA